MKTRYRKTVMNLLLASLLILYAGPALSMDKADSSSVSGAGVKSEEASPDKPLEELLPINVNTADAKTLVRVPGINKKAANQIVAHREKKGKYTKLDQLIGFAGIGETSVFRLKKYLVVQ